jgi:hypothetical protein
MPFFLNRYGPAALPRTVHRPQVLIVYDAQTVDGHLLQHLVCDTLKSWVTYDLELVPGPMVVV